VLEGEVILFKTEKESSRQFAIGKLGKGEIFGEMSFIDDSLRSSSIKANNEVTVIKLSRVKFESAPPALRDIYSRLTRNTAKIIIKRLRDTNESVIKRRRKESYERIAFNELGKVVIRLIVWLQIVGGICGLIYLGNYANGYLPTISGAALLLMLIPIYRLITSYQYPTSQLGLTWIGWQRSLLKAFLYGSSSCLLIAIALIQMHFFSVDNSLLTTLPAWHDLLIYPFYVFAAEFLLRGVMQTLMQKIMATGAYSSAIIYNALAVAATNFYFGAAAVCIVLLINLLCGYIYLSERNLLAVTLVHLATGLLLKFVNVLPAANFF
jgi:hypothetical protein